MKFNEIAAKWWADNLRNITPKNFDNGDTSSAGGFGMMLATMLAINSASSNENIDLFEKRLSETIKEIVEQKSSLTLSVDYAPDSILGNLAKETNISTNGFPWKTTMWITKEKVSVSAGYAAPEVVIFPIKI